jgi:hypothetical protein
MDVMRKSAMDAGSKESRRNLGCEGQKSQEAGQRTRLFTS